MEENQNNKKYVRWVIFVWAIGIIIMIFGVMFNALGGINNRVETNTASMGTIKEDIREIKTNVDWIKEAIKKQK